MKPVNNIWKWLTRSHFLSPSMFVAHVNGRCVEICENIKWPFFLHVPISLKKILFTIMGHGMNMIVEVLPPCLWTLSYLHIWQWIWWWRGWWKSFWRTMCCWYVWANDTRWYFPQCGKKKDHNQPSSSSTSTKKTLVWMGDIIQNITNEIKESGVQFIDHATSLLRVITTYVWSIHFSKVNEIMHLDMVFHCVNDGLGNSVHWMKD